MLQTTAETQTEVQEWLLKRIHYIKTTCAYKTLSSYFSHLIKKLCAMRQFTNKIKKISNSIGLLFSNTWSCSCENDEDDKVMYMRYALHTFNNMVMIMIVTKRNKNCLRYQVSHSIQLDNPIIFIDSRILVCFSETNS